MKQRAVEYIELGPQHVYPLADVLVPLVKAADELAAKFGLGPSSPVFCVHSGMIEARAEREGVGRRWKRHRHRYVRAKSLRDEDHDLKGWAPIASPHRLRIMVSSKTRDGAFRLRSVPEMFKTIVHETGHRLAFEGVVDWPLDIDGGECSSEVAKFADAVSEVSSPRSIVLPAPYDALARKARGADDWKRTGVVVATADGVRELLLRPNEMLIRRAS